MTDALQHEAVLPLWNGRPEGTPDDLAPLVEERSKNLFRPDRALTGIAEPSLTAWIPKHPNGTSIIIAPGGSYRRVVLDKEGIEIARALAPLGITSFLLTYRLPGEGHANRADAPIADAQRAMRLVRGHAEKWDLNPERIGFLGFSAAGHLGASLATRYDQAAYEVGEDEQTISARPDFIALIYPVVTMQDDDVHEGSRTALLGDSPTSQQKLDRSPEVHVTADSPETFLVLADDDLSVPPANAVAFYSALHEAGVKAELHIFRDGGHGFGISGAKNKPVAGWPYLLTEWMMQIGVMPETLP
ncbi:alpha/beta hydrolase [Vreelandella nanhaiensis]|uniref:Alpha/beta hydrolase n=1 Tax=Vreelandella nanhaiensis TaxID=1258546 RepID=A0A3S0W816_9GAMM|nr:alpha/beta hydrolase [Halomonas nanhaiensis]RUR34298.1 alpha/beta hydrolase [Halomonas nanhaiensis]